jgi:hypothetical protein
MRTVHDIRDAFATLADAAPAPEELSIATTAQHPMRTRRQRRRRLAPAAAALATAAVVGGVVFATSSPDSGRPSGSPGSLQPLPAPKTTHSTPDLTFRFTADAPVGTTVVRRGIDRAGQVLDYLTPPTGRPCPPSTPTDLMCRRVAEVRLNYLDPPRDPDEPNSGPADVVDRDPVRVNGHRGFFGRIPNGVDGGTKHLYWEYAHGAWAEAIAPSPAAMLALAESVRPASGPVQVPVDPSPTLDGEYLNIVASERSAYGGSFEVSTPHARSGGYFVNWGLGAGENGGPKVVDPQDVIVNGRTWTIGWLDLGGPAGSVRGVGELVARLKGSDVPLVLHSDLATSKTEVMKILKGLRLAADLADRSTWFDAADVLP